MASPVANRYEDGNISSPVRNRGYKFSDIKYKDIENECARAEFAGTENVSSLLEHDDNTLSKLLKVDENRAAKSTSNPAFRRKKVACKLKSRRCPFRSSLGGGRVLPSMSKSNSKTETEPVSTPQVNQVTKSRKKRRQLKRASNDEFSVIRKRIRYLLTRMNYEQNLIDAYSGEGWKGQSAEKIKPEKELERAKSEILRCKFKIRELFCHLDSLSSDGRFDDSLFDSEGLISSEDIFCAKCNLKDSTTDNDIILCDGICDRGFHQKCLNPPLSSEDIPVGDEGWLCPACDCKVDCLELLEEFQGDSLDIKDKWQKIFPEAGSVANGDNQHDGLPSDDSEDYNYDPDDPEVDGSDQEESNFNSSPEDSDASNKNEKTENLGLPSDDSEDDDYNPDAPDLDLNIQKNGQSSDESDFTSDSDAFCNELRKSSGANEETVYSLMNLKPFAQSDDGRVTGDVKNSEILSTSEKDLNQENVLLSKKRQLDRLDYKKLYDEMYGTSSSDSSEDEEWAESSDRGTPNGGKKYAKRKESNVLSQANGQIIKNQKNSRNSSVMFTEVNIVMKSDASNSRVSQVVNETTPEKPHRPLDSSTGEHTIAAGQQNSKEPDSGASRSAHKRLGDVATQKLYSSFQENQYPTREKRECLAQELGLTYRQVDKWFVNARHSYRVSSKEGLNSGTHTPVKENNRTEMTTTSTTRGGGETVEGDIFQRSPSSANKRRRKSMPAKKTCGDNMSELDEERQKAIARELRKMKQGR